jgi:hypothetical protein
VPGILSWEAIQKFAINRAYSYFDPILSAGNGRASEQAV